MSNNIVIKQDDTVDEITSIFVQDNELVIRHLIPSLDIDRFDDKKGQVILACDDLLCNKVYKTFVTVYDWNVMEDVVKPKYLVELEDGKRYKIDTEAFLSIDKINGWVPSNELAIYTKNGEAIVRGMLNETCTHNNLRVYSCGDEVYQNEYNTRYIMTVCLYGKCLNFVECPKCISVNSTKFVTNIDGSQKDLYTWYKSITPCVHIQCPDTIQPNQFVECVVECDNDCVLNVDVISGYSSHTKLNVVNGMCRFRVAALHINVGHEVKFNVGTDIHPNLFTKTIAVV